MKTAQKIYKQDLKEHRKKFWGKKWGLGVGRKVSPLFAVERVKRLIPGGKEPAYQCRGQKRGRFGPWVGRIPQRKNWIENEPQKEGGEISPLCHPLPLKFCIGKGPMLPKGASPVAQQ